MRACLGPVDEGVAGVGRGRDSDASAAVVSAAAAGRTPCARRRTRRHCITGAARGVNVDIVHHKIRGSQGDGLRGDSDQVEGGGRLEAECAHRHRVVAAVGSGHRHGPHRRRGGRVGIGGQADRRGGDDSLKIEGREGQHDVGQRLVELDIQDALHHVGRKVVVRESGQNPSGGGVTRHRKGRVVGRAEVGGESAGRLIEGCGLAAGQCRQAGIEVERHAGIVRRKVGHQRPVGPGGEAVSRQVAHRHTVVRPVHEPVAGLRCRHHHHVRSDGVSAIAAGETLAGRRGARCDRAGRRKVGHQRPVAGDGKQVVGPGADRQAVQRPIDEDVAGVGRRRDVDTRSGQVGAVADGEAARQGRSAGDDVTSLREVGHQRSKGGGGEIIAGQGADLQPVLGPVHKRVAGVGCGHDGDRGAAEIDTITGGRPTGGGRGGGCDEVLRGAGHFVGDVVQQKSGRPSRLNVDRDQVEGGGRIKGEQAHRQRAKPVCPGGSSRADGRCQRGVCVGHQADGGRVLNRGLLGGGKIKAHVGQQLAELDDQHSSGRVGVQVVAREQVENQRGAEGVLNRETSRPHAEVGSDSANGLVEGQVLARSKGRAGGIEIKGHRGLGLSRAGQEHAHQQGCPQGGSQGPGCHKEKAQSINRPHQGEAFHRTHLSVLDFNGLPIVPGLFGIQFIARSSSS